MQLPSNPDEERDLRTMMVADHGVDPSPVPGRRRPEPKPAGAGWRDTLVWCGVPVVIILLLRVFVFGMYAIPSGSMENTIMPGDRVLTLSLAPKVVDLKRGDIVVFKDPSNWLRNEQTDSIFGKDRLIKRLIGLPGDVVECAGEGSPVTINGVAIDESAYIRPGVAPSSFPFRVEVTEGHVFVMGDNRSNSADSRYHQDDEENGLVPLEDIEGVALATYWPLQRIGALDSHHDVFADVPGADSVGL
ncbi:signal peptidase I [Bifidobacterium pullorum]|uniref:signal peptidase I n=1 Tax=Bifidobacterium pullorum TaxID=78448 RepID=UPI0009DD2F10|nr:signal peptidase I [Bifidobacterium pullorum]